MLRNLRSFKPKEIFKDKRVAVIGAAESAFRKENGKYIDSFDIVIRINKAIFTWKPCQEQFIGRKTDVVFHSFYENKHTGGGPIDLDLFKSFGVKYLVNPHHSPKGYLSHLNYYKRKQESVETHMLSRPMYKKMTDDFGRWIPTVGFAALYSVLNSPCKEVFITGFTFFRTPYTRGYRDHFYNIENNLEHIKQQGLHNIDLEFELFKILSVKNECGEVLFDEALTALLEPQKQ